MNEYDVYRYVNMIMSLQYKQVVVDQYMSTSCNEQHNNPSSKSTLPANVYIAIFRRSFSIVVIQDLQCILSVENVPPERGWIEEEKGSSFVGYHIHDMGVSPNLHGIVVLGGVYCW